MFSRWSFPNFYWLAILVITIISIDGRYTHLNFSKVYIQEHWSEIILECINHYFAIFENCYVNALRNSQYATDFSNTQHNSVQEINPFHDRLGDEKQRDIFLILWYCSIMESRQKIVIHPEPQGRSLQYIIVLNKEKWPEKFS